MQPLLHATITLSLARSSHSDAFDFSLSLSAPFMHFKSCYHMRGERERVERNIHISNHHACCIRKLPPLDSTWYRQPLLHSLSLSHFNFEQLFFHSDAIHTAHIQSCIMLIPHINPSSIFRSMSGGEYERRLLAPSDWHYIDFLVTYEIFLSETNFNAH